MQNEKNRVSVKARLLLKRGPRRFVPSIQRTDAHEADQVSMDRVKAELARFQTFVGQPFRFEEVDRRPIHLLYAIGARLTVSRSDAWVSDGRELKGHLRGRTVVTVPIAGLLLMTHDWPLLQAVASHVVTKAIFGSSS